MNNIQSSSFQNINPDNQDIRVKSKKENPILEIKLKKSAEIQDKGTFFNNQNMQSKTTRQTKNKKLKTLRSKQVIKTHNVKTTVFPENEKKLEEVFQTIDDLCNKTIEEKNL